MWVTTSNSLAAHCWPILSALVGDAPPSDLDPENADKARPLCPLLVIFNCRRHLGLPPTFFGNCASFSAVQPSTTHEDPSSLALKVRAPFIECGKLLSMRSGLISGEGQQGFARWQGRRRKKA